MKGSPRPPPLEEVGDSVCAIDEAILLDQDGQPRRLSSVYADRRVVMCFTRHLGCRFCKQQAAELSRVAHKLCDYGAAPVLVALGRPHHLEKWRVDTGWEWELYVDADPWDPPTYRLLGLLRAGKSSEFLEDPRVRFLADLASHSGFTDGGFSSPKHRSQHSGNTMQYGGVFVLGPGARCDYAFHSEYPGHHPSPARLVKVCRLAARRTCRAPGAVAVPRHAPEDAHRVAWGFEVLAVAFCAIEACFVAALSMVPARFGAGVGSAAAGTLYLLFAAATLAAPATVRLLGARLTLVAGLATFGLFIAACAGVTLAGLPPAPVLLPTAALAGAGGAVLWTAEGVYLARAATTYSRALDQEGERVETLRRLRGEATPDGGKVAARARAVDLFAGIFNVVFQVSMPAGQLLSGLLLSHYGSTVQYAALLVTSFVALAAVARVPEPRRSSQPISAVRSGKGIVANIGTRRGSGVAQVVLTPVSQAQRRDSLARSRLGSRAEWDVAPAASDGASAAGTAATGTSLTPQQQRAFTTDDLDNSPQNPGAAARAARCVRLPATLRLVVTDRRMALLAPTNLAQGVMSSLLTYYVGARVVAPPPPRGYGTAAIGPLMAVQGVAAALLAPVFAAAAHRCGRGAVLALGAACWAAECLVLLWLLYAAPPGGAPARPEYWVLLCTFVLHGAGFSVWQGTGTAAHVAFFHSSRAALEAAFANIKLWSGLGTAAGFFCFPSVSDAVMLYTGLAAVALGIFLYPLAASAARAAAAEGGAAGPTEAKRRGGSVQRARADTSVGASEQPVSASRPVSYNTLEPFLPPPARAGQRRVPESPAGSPNIELTLSFSGPALCPAASEALTQGEVLTLASEDTDAETPLLAPAARP
eukprot:TRINITY_DN35368_c1_g1_i1.p1 TRINITY_DN35368_c1_g1~~TRINITY_DN35368_c1_g1_i1.p1  ORF type:complete len:906 (+),score=228.44 TRINITY_DN35368_c1_g1_i1:101-2719(+)